MQHICLDTAYIIHTVNKVSTSTIDKGDKLAFCSHKAMMDGLSLLRKCKLLLSTVGVFLLLFVVSLSTRMVGPVLDVADPPRPAVENISELSMREMFRYAANGPATAQPKRLNIIFVMADHMGYGA